MRDADNPIIFYRHNGTIEHLQTEADLQWTYIFVNRWSHKINSNINYTNIIIFKKAKAHTRELRYQCPGIQSMQTTINVELY